MKAMETLAAAVRSLREKLSRLEHGASCPGDWVRLEVAVTRTVIEARQAACGAGVGQIDCDALGALMDELRYIKLCAEAHQL